MYDAIVVDILLHWHCDGHTYSVKRLTHTTGFLIMTDKSGVSRRARRPIPEERIRVWASLELQERCRQADEEMAFGR